MKRRVYSIVISILILAAVIVVVFFLEYFKLLDSVRFLSLKAASPGVSMTQSTLANAKGFFSTLTSISDLVKENEALRQRVDHSDQVEADALQLKAENEQLRKTMGLQEEKGLDVVPCGILGADVGGLAGGVVVGCGESAGVREGMVVLLGDLVFGTVALAQKDTATIRPLSVTQSTIDAYVPSEDVSGVVKGSAGVGVVFEVVSKDLRLAQGTLLVTGGINGRVKPGIPIGRITSLVSKETDLVERYSIQAQSNIKIARTLFVVK